MPTLFEISVPVEDIFPGHVVTLLAIPNDTGNIYYCMQSFVHQYTPKLKKLSEEEFILYLTNFALVFRTVDENNNITIHKNLWEICTWTPYNDDFSETLIVTDFFVTITKAVLLPPSQICVNYIKYLGMGYGIFLSLKFFVKNLFNISNNVCSCKFLKTGDFRKEKSKCKNHSGDHNIDNTIYNKYRYKYPNIKSDLTRNEIINIFKLYEYISIIFKTNDPEEFVTSFNKSFGSNILDVNSTNTLARLEDYIKRFENSQIKLLILRTNPYLGELRRYFICIFLTIVDAMYTAMISQNSRTPVHLNSLTNDAILKTPDYKNILFWLQSVSPSYKSHKKNIYNYKIFEVISIVEFINNNIYPDIRYFFLNITQDNFIHYLTSHINDNSLITNGFSKYLESVINRYKLDKYYRKFIHGFSHDIVFGRFNSNTIFTFYLNSCDNKGNNKEQLSSFFVNFINQPETYQNNIYKILLLASIKFIITIT